MLVHHLLEASAAKRPDAPALIELRRTTSYAELDAVANRFARMFGSAGIVAGDRVVIALDNCLEMVGAYLGAMKAGAVAVPLPGGAGSDRLAYATADCAPKAAVIDAATARSTALHDAFAPVPAVFVKADRRGPGQTPLPGARDLDSALAHVEDGSRPVAVSETDLAAIIYTSGSTGEPRGVMLSHRNIVSNARSIVDYLGLTAGDRVMCVLPFYYVYALSLMHTHLQVGGAIVLDNRFMYPNVVLAAMQEHQVTGFAGVPSTFALLLHRSNLREMQFSALRYVTQAGGAMAPPLIREWLRDGPAAPFFVMYGATEASARLTYLPPADLERKLGSIGRPIPGVHIRIITDEGLAAAPREVGELVASGANVSTGYWNDPEGTAERFGPEGYRTGDLGYVDDEGFLFLVGRRHDMLKVGAHRVGAKEIEDVLQEHPAVHEVAVVGAPHNILGEVPVAFVSLRSGVHGDGDEIRAFCRPRLATHKVPARVEVLGELPKSSGAGKIDKLSLRARASSVASELADHPQNPAVGA